jgi:hypothetical protein
MKKSYLISRYVLTLLVVLLFGKCVDPHLGMHYQRVLLDSHWKAPVYCYLFDWGLDAWCYYISTEENVCAGFDTTRDICIGMGDRVIYYRMERDTLCVYADSGPTIPASFAVPVKYISLGNADWKKYENAYQRKEMNKVQFDNHAIETPCPLVFDKANDRISNRN